MNKSVCKFIQIELAFCVFFYILNNNVYYMILIVVLRSICMHQCVNTSIILVNLSEVSFNVFRFRASRLFSKLCNLSFFIIIVSLNFPVHIFFFLYFAGYYGDGFNALVVFAGCYLPDKSRRDYNYVMDNLFL